MTTRRALAALLSCGLLSTALPAAGQAVDISEWLVPWPKSEPRDPFVDPAGRVWFTGERGEYIANLRPETGDFARFDIVPGSKPQGLVATTEGDIWIAATGAGFLGRLNRGLGGVDRFDLPNRRARDPYALALDADGRIWFTVERGNFVGRLDPASGEIHLIPVTARRARPHGIVVDARGEPWAGAGNSNLLLRIDPDRMSIAEIELPEKKARPRRLAATSDGGIWYGDYARGMLGRFDPQSGEFAEWPLPGGADSEPWGMAADRFDRLWLVETGSNPNRLVGFNPATSEFFSISDIPSGGDTVRSLHYYEPAGELWFATDTNYIGRASVH